MVLQVGKVMRVGCPVCRQPAIGYDTGIWICFGCLAHGDALARYEYEALGRPAVSGSDWEQVRGRVRARIRSEDPSPWLGREAAAVLSGDLQARRIRAEVRRGWEANVLGALSPQQLEALRSFEVPARSRRSRAAWDRRGRAGRGQRGGQGGE